MLVNSFFGCKNFKDKNNNAFNKKMAIVIFANMIISIILSMFCTYGNKKLQDPIELYSVFDCTEEQLIWGIQQPIFETKYRVGKIGFLISNCDNDSEGYVILQIYSNDQLVYNGTISACDVLNDRINYFYYNNFIFPNSEMFVFFDGFENNPSIVLGKSDIESIVDGIPTDETSLQVYVQARDERGWLDTVLFWVFSLALFALLGVIEKSSSIILGLCTCNNRKKIPGLTILEIFGILISFDIFLKNELSVSTVLIMILLIIAVNCNWYEMLPAGEKLQRSILKNKTIIYALAILLTFCFIGSRVFVWPIDKSTSLFEIGIFFVCYLCSVPFVVSLFWVIERIVFINKTDFNTEDSFKWIFFDALLFSIFPVIGLVAFNPGISAYDTAVCLLEEAHSIHGIVDWQTAIYCIFLHWCIKICDSTYFVLFIQYFLWIWVVCKAGRILRRRGASPKFTSLIAFAFGSTTSTILYMNTILKDIPYAACMVLTLLAFINIIDDSVSIIDYVEITVGLVGVCLIRNNGFVVYIFCIFVILVFSLHYKRNTWKMIAVAAITVCIVALVKIPIYQYYGVISANTEGQYPGGKYIGLGQDLLGTYFNYGIVDEECMGYISIMTGNLNDYDYNPTFANQTYDLMISPGDFVKEYIQVFLHNPVLMIRSALARQDVLWDIPQNDSFIVGCVNYFGTMDDSNRFYKWNDYYPRRESTAIFPGMVRYCEIISECQIIDWIVWRAGLSSWIGFFALSLALVRVKNKKVIWLYTPIFSSALCLFLSSGWSEFRYYWPGHLMNYFILIYYVIYISYEERANSCNN